MKERSPARAWLKWLLLAAFAACLNPHPDDEPTVTPVRGNEPSDSPGDTSSNEGPPLLDGDDADTGQQTETPRDAADAGEPSADAGVTSADAGPSVSH